MGRLENELMSEATIRSNALVYAIINREGGDRAMTGSTVYDNTRLFHAIEPELGDDDVFTVIKPGHFSIMLSNTNELAAMQIARLVRNAFQQFSLSSQKETMSIGVVLYSSKTVELSTLRKVALNLINTAHKTRGNNIEYIHSTRVVEE